MEAAERIPHERDATRGIPVLPNCTRCSSDIDDVPVTPAFFAAAPTPTQHHLVARSWADPSNCVDDYTDSSSHCDSLQTTVDRCVSLLDNGDVKSQDGPFAGCFCQPAIYSELVECQNQHRQCLRDLVMDPQFSHYRSQWEDFCTSANPALSVSTPDLTTPSPVTSFKNPCSYIKSACNRYDRYTSECQSSVPDNLSACYCQTHVVEFESICSLDGIALCSKPPIETAASLWGYASCGRARQGYFTIPDWAMVDATVQTPTTVPFADFPLTYNDVPTETPGSQSLASGQSVPILLIGICWILSLRW